MMYRNEKCGGVLVPESMLSGFRNVVFECGLFDIHMDGLKFTWQRGNTREKLDRFFATRSWIDLFQNNKGEVLAMGSSDHAPIELMLCRHLQDKPRKKRFYFEDFWVRKPACREVVESVTP